MTNTDRQRTGEKAGKYLAVGLMSGTSVDGIDAALTRYELGDDGSVSPELVEALTAPIPEPVRTGIFELFEDGAGSLSKLALLDLELGSLFAAAALEVIGKAGITPGEVDVIGSHGQTVRHLAGRPGLPGRASVQIGSGAVIARTAGIPTACDFRPGDIAAGGTGAPLVPFFDKAIADRFEKPVAFQNIGGIGNVCLVGSSGRVTAFDTGPGNMIADRLAYLLSGGADRFDRDGLYGSRGRVLPDVLDRWMDHEYLAKRPPKSCGREEFGSAFFEREIAGFMPGPESRLCDLIRTAEAFVARSAARAYREFLPEMPVGVIVTGGGARNPHIMADLRSALPGSTIRDGDSAGISTDFKEAMAFGLFGLFRLLGLPNTEPSATGAWGPVCAGALHLP